MPFFNVESRPCRICQNPIPDTRRLNATVCSDVCSKKRAIQFTQDWVKPHPEVKWRRASLEEHLGRLCEECGEEIPSSRRINAKTCGADCAAARLRRKSREWVEAHPEQRRKYDRDKARKSRLRFKYGLTEQEYDALFDAQNGVCGCCGKTVEWLCVDHDHMTGVVRGLLCNDCNLGIGILGDSEEAVFRAFVYLSRSSTGARRLKNQRASLTTTDW